MAPINNPIDTADQEAIGYPVGKTEAPPPDDGEQAPESQE